MFKTFLAKEGKFDAISGNNNNTNYNFGIHNLFNSKYITTYLPLGPRPGAPLHAYFGVSQDF